MTAHDVTIRSFRHGDLADLQALCNDSLVLDRFDIPTLRRRILDDPAHASELSLVAESAGRLVGCAFGVLNEMAGDRVGRLKLWAVDPSHQGLGLGTRMLQMLEERFAAAGAGAVITQGAPHYFHPGVDVRYTRALCILQKRGYEPGLYTENMEVPLIGRSFDTTRDEADLRAAGFTVERLRPENLPDLVRFVAEQFNPVWEGEVKLSLSVEPVPMFVAWYEARIVAFACYDLVAFPGSFGPMGTHPDVRGKGLGAVLLKHCLTDMQSKGYTRCEICWIGPADFYSRAVGARISRVFRTPCRSGFQPRSASGR